MWISPSLKSGDIANDDYVLSDNFFDIAENNSYQTDFYFTNGAVQIRNGYDMWVSEGGKPFIQIDNCDPSEIFDFQLNEFIKLLKNEASEVVSPEYGKEVIAVLEKALSQIP